MTNQIHTAIINKEFIDNLKPTNEKIIDKYLKAISKEISNETKLIGINKARQSANIKFGKFWRERLNSKKVYNSVNPFGKISYY